MIDIKKIVIVFVFVLLFTPTGFAVPDKINLQLRTYNLVVPSYGVGIPIKNGDTLELGYSNFTFFGEYNVGTVVYSLKLSSAQNERTSFNLGLMFYHIGSTARFGVSSLPKDGTVPVLLYEQERLINEDISWLINFGYPNLIGFGLKYYL